jgi:hypothetical protein
MENIKNILFKQLQDPNIIFDMIIHSLILFTFLTLFFSFYVSKISTDVFNEEVNNIINENIDHTIDNLKGSQTIVQELLINNLPLDKISNYYNGVDSTVDAKNKGLLHSLWIANIILWGCFLIGTFLIYDIYNLHVKDIMIENILTFIIIGIAEYLFFTRIGLKFVPVEPSFISKQFLDKSKELI